jgi:hypothetical protein
MMTASNLQAGLFDAADHEEQYTPRPIDLFRPQRIILAKGSLSKPKRRSLADRICAANPAATVEERLGTAHN